jgi:hypothetical protein
MTKRKALRYGLVLLAVLFLAEVISYVFLAPSAIAMAPAELFSSSAREFCCVSHRLWASLSSQEQQALDRQLRQRFAAVYHSEAEIPDAQKKTVQIDGRQLLVSVEDGFILSSWQITKRRPFYFRAEYSTWCGGLCGSGNSVLFVWVLYKWVPVWSQMLWIS